VVVCVGAFVCGRSYNSVTAENGET